MTHFVPVHIHLSHAQGLALMHGRRVRIEPRAIGVGEHSIFVSPRKAAKLAKRQAEHRGILLGLSAAEIKHTAVHGGGFMDFLRGVGNAFKKVGQFAYRNVAKPAFNEVVKPLAGQVIQHVAPIALQLATNAIERRLGGTPATMAQMPETGESQVEGQGLSLHLQRARRRPGFAASHAARSRRALAMPRLPAGSVPGHPYLRPFAPRGAAVLAGPRRSSRIRRPARARGGSFLL